MTRTIRVYDYANNAVDINIPDKEIASISIIVISGDETGTIYFKDGECIDFDSSSTRFCAFYDGHYLVNGTHIEEWINFTPTLGRTFSYEREAAFNFYEPEIEMPKETQKVSEDMCCDQPFLSQAGQWICTEPGNYVFFDKTTDKVWRVTEITDEIVFEEE